MNAYAEQYVDIGEVHRALHDPVAADLPDGPLRELLARLQREIDDTRDPVLVIRHHLPLL